MIGKLYKTLKGNEFDLFGHCTCCAGDKWTGHASWCKVNWALEEYEAKLAKIRTLGGGEGIKSICTAIEALEEFQAAHYDWPYVRKETEAIKMQLESALSRFESLLEDMEKIEKEEALA